MKYLEHGHPRNEAMERHSSSLRSFVNFSTKSTTFAGEEFRGGTQNDEPGTKGNQSGVAFLTRIRWMRSSNLFKAISYSPSFKDDETDDDDEPNSIWMSWGLEALEDRWRWCWSRTQGAIATLGLQEDVVVVMDWPWRRSVRQRNRAIEERERDGEFQNSGHGYGKRWECTDIYTTGSGRNTRARG